MESKGIFIIVAVLALGLFAFYLQQANYNDQPTIKTEQVTSPVGAVVTGSTGAQCDDTDQTATSATELEAQDSVFTEGGTRTRPSSSGSWSTITYDSCSGALARINERYCTSSATAVSENVGCIYGCTNIVTNRNSVGACKTPTCYETDASSIPGMYTSQGQTYGIPITDSDYLGVPPSNSGPVARYDSCISSSTLREYSCVSSGGISKIVANDYSCASLGSGYICQSGRCKLSSATCTPTTEICDGDDNDCDGAVDESCDVDNDDYCNSYMTIESPYSCSGFGSCCPLGGGDCRDGTVGYGSGGLPNQVNPSRPESCFDNLDNDCDGVINEGCVVPYTCTDSDPTNNPTVLSTITETAGSGQTETKADYCSPYSSTIYESKCPPPPNSTWPGYAYFDHYQSVACPTGTTCGDPDGPTGPQAAYCA